MKFLIHTFSLILLFLFLGTCSDNPLENQNSSETINKPPEIDSILANPDTVIIGLNSILTCIAEDPDSDELEYLWESEFGTISDSGSSVIWHSPNSTGTYLILCEVKDGNGGTCKDTVSVFVIDTTTITENIPPQIISLTADPNTVILGLSAYINCIAEDLNGDELYYNWIYHFGTISGSGSSVTWTAPNKIGTYLILCEVNDGYGGSSKDSIFISVEDDYAGNIPSHLIVVPSFSFPTIQSAINGSTEGDTVLIMPGTYYENLDMGGKNIILTGLHILEEEPLYIKNTIVDGQGKWSVIVINKGETEDCIISGLTLRNGVGVQSSGIEYSKGGGIYCTDSAPTLRNLIISNNIAAFGSGIYFSEAKANLENVIIRDNIAENLNIRSSVYCSNCEVNLKMVTIKNNEGIGLDIQGGSDIVLSDLLILNNSTIGCKLFNSSVNKFKNNVLVNNGSYGIRLSAVGILNVESCTVANNGSGLSNGENGVNVINSIFWNKTTEFELSTVMSGYSSVSVRYSDVKGNLTSYGSGNINFDIDSTCISLDPKFCDPENGDYHIESTSPCVNSGENGGLMGAIGVGCE